MGVILPLMERFVQGCSFRRFVVRWLLEACNRFALYSGLVAEECNALLVVA